MVEPTITDAAIDAFSRAETTCCDAGYNPCCIRAGLAAAAPHIAAQALRDAAEDMIECDDVERLLRRADGLDPS